MTLATLPGQSYPLGATVRDNGVNFSVFSKNAESVELLLFDHPDDVVPSHTIKLDPQKNKTFYYWHVFVPGIGHGQIYAYRVYGPYAPEMGMRFDPGKILIEPYTRLVTYNENYDRARAKGPWENLAHSMRSVVVDNRLYDWEGDTPLNLPFPRSCIYEVHVGGFTRHHTSGLSPETRGTYAGFIEKIPYLKDLGITAVELLPVQQFDPQDAPQGLSNYWGYQPVAFFAPHREYSSDPSPLGPINEFRDMVKSLHRAGIEVIIDVVFNHTTEGDHNGPTISFRGFENIAYYLLEPDQVHYKNYSGTGNTLNANHSIVRRMIRDCLRYWVQEMHVDGFRFDLASVLSRGESGQVLTNPPLLWEIESEPVLAGTKIIAEAWDAAGLYQVGSFIGHRWAEWNAHYRDDVRRFIRGDSNTVRPLAARLVGSPDLYPQPDREPNRSINFVTAHDGFTLNDLVSYNQKHNLANGEFNRDGLNENFSWNCGVEGPTSSPEILALRRRQMKNFFVILMLSQGTPMINMGDEIARTQQGNNNAYCQDNEISWFNWDHLTTNAELLRFTQKLLFFSKQFEVVQQERYLRQGNLIPGVIFPPPPTDPLNNGRKNGGKVTWHGVKLFQPDWGDASHSLAFTLEHPSRNEWLHIILNAWWNRLVFELPQLPAPWRWHRVIDTSLPSPEDILDLDKSTPWEGNTIPVLGRSSVVLVGRKSVEQS